MKHPLLLIYTYQGWERALNVELVSTLWFWQDVIQWQGFKLQTMFVGHIKKTSTKGVRRFRIEPGNPHVCCLKSCRGGSAVKENRWFEVFTHAGTSEFVTLDHGGGCSQLGRPSSAGQTSRPAADHQKVEPGRVRRRRVWGHASADECVSAKGREKLFSVSEPAGWSARSAQLG